AARPGQRRGGATTTGGGGYKSWWEARGGARFFSRLRGGLGCRPRVRGGPRGPSVTQLLLWRSCGMLWGSTASRVGGGFGGGCRTRSGEGVGVKVQRGAGSQDDGALQDIFQFADVTRPGIRQEAVHRRLADGVEALADPRRELVDQEAHQQGDVLAPLAQG